MNKGWAYDPSLVILFLEVRIWKAKGDFLELSLADIVWKVAHRIAGFDPDVIVARSRGLFSKFPDPILTKLSHLFPNLDPQHQHFRKHLGQVD